MSLNNFKCKLLLFEYQLNKNNFQKRKEKKNNPFKRLIISVSHYCIIMKVTEYNQEKRKETNHLDVIIFHYFAAK